MVPKRALTDRIRYLLALNPPSPIEFARYPSAICAKEIAGWLTTQEILQKFDISLTTIRKARTDGILQPIAQYRLVSYFDAQDIHGLTGT